MTAKVAFRQDDVARAVRGVTAGGLRVAKVEVEVSPNGGKITIVTGDGAATLIGPSNPLDRVLNDEAPQDAPA
jgi:hypothetical protein